MDIIEVAFNYIQNRSDEDIKRDSVSISTQYDTLESYEVAGRYSDKSILGTSKDSFEVKEDSRLYTLIKTCFQNAIDGLSITGAEVTTISLRQTDYWEQMEYPFYSSNDADAQFFIGVSKTSVPEEIQNELTGMVVELLSDWDESVTEDSITNSEWFFDDMAIVELLNVSGIVRTKYPQRYFDVDSPEEYKKKSNKDYEPNQEYFNIRYKCSVDPNSSMMKHITTEMKNRVEEIMWDHIGSTLNTSWEYKIEGEVIQFGKEGEYEEADDLMKYYIYIPVFEGTRGI